MPASWWSPRSFAEDTARSNAHTTAIFAGGAGQVPEFRNYPRSGILGQSDAMKARRLGFAAVALVVVGCGRTSLEWSPPARSDAAMVSDGSGDSTRDEGALADAHADAGSPSDVGAAGSCGSRISFSIVAAAGVDPGSFCTYGCNSIGEIAFANNDIQLTTDDVVAPNCVSLCDACGSPTLCHSCSGIGLFPSAGVNYTWDGSHWATGICGANSCRGPRLCAPAGHFAGTFCAWRGTTVSGRCTPSQGSPGADVSCTTVEFDLPSTESITVELGP